MVGGYVRKRVTLRISKGLRAVALAAGISLRVYSDTRVIFITIIAICIALAEKIGTPLIILGALFHSPDLTPRFVCLVETCRRRHHRPSPKSTSATSMSPRELQALHASKNTRDPLLTTSATDPALVDRRSTPGEHRSSKP
jgi:hypothetical protein